MRIKKLRLLLVILIITVMFVTLFLSFAKLINYYRVKNAKVYIVLRDTLKTEVYSNVEIEDFIDEINGDIIDNKKIDTSKIGKQKISFEYINEDNIKIPYSYTIDVVDETKPIISKYSNVDAYVGEDKFYKDIFCGDNYDNKPKCYVKGDYDINKVGDYDIEFFGEDTSGNISSQKITLHVKEKPKKSKNKTTKKNSKMVDFTSFKDIKKDYKKDNIKVGIDVSKWQGQINYKKVKHSGVEFVIIKVGGQDGINGEYVLDPNFKSNIKGFNKQKIPVGVYFYSHANSKDEAIKQAKWVVDQVKRYDISLPIVFDWENWDSYQQYKLSFHNLNNIADEFMSYIKDKDYKPMLYGSKSYLETIWDTNKKDIWLADYTKYTDYSGSHKLWQLCDDGKVNGINNYVDIDLLYE